MRLDLKIVLATSALFMLGGVAHADGSVAPTQTCTRTVYGAGWSNYPIQDLADYATRGSVLQGGGTRNCGRWYGDVFTSYALDDSGDYGERGFGDEWDVTFGNAGQFRSFLGPIDYDVNIAYWMLSSFSTGDDDMVALEVQLGRPFETGDVTITPYVNVNRWISLGVYDDAWVVRPGVETNWQISQHWSANVDVAVSFGGIDDDTDESTWIDRGVWRVNPTVTYSSESWSIWGGARFTEDLDPAIGAGFSRTF